MSIDGADKRCIACSFEGSPDQPLVIIDDEDGEVLICWNAADCAERMNDRADLVPYVTGEAP